MKARAIPASLPAPVGGWNARDALGEMPPGDAVILQNWFPGTTYCVMRNGFSNWATGLSAQVETVAAYAGLAANKFVAAAGTNIYDVTAAGVVGAPVQTGLSNARWQYVNYANTSGNYLYMVNGADAPRYWDGTTWTNAAITGVTPTNLIHINAFKNRLWFVEVGTLNAWYLATSAIAGAATKFDLTGISLMGGSLMAIATWTIDAGYGVDDLLVFLTTKGEVIIYRGTDPSSAATWAIVGIFQMGSPIGRRCFMKYKGDLCVINQDGLTPLAQGLQSSRLDPRINLTDKIQQATSLSISNFGSNFGWEVVQFSKENMILLNVPVSVGTQQQYVMNTINGSWCNFTGWAANCFEIFNDDLYFGGNGVVCKAWNTLSDNGANISADGLQAFNYFKSDAILKRFTMMRPILYSNGAPQILGNVNVNFDLSNTSAPLNFVPVPYGSWDSGLWDSAIWAGDLAVSQLWQGVNAIGYCGGVRLISASQGIQVQWVATDVVFERGGIL